MNKKKLYNAIMVSLMTLVIMVTVVIVTVTLLTKPDIKISVISDLHYMDDEQFDISSKAYGNYSLNKDKMMELSPAICKTVIDNLADSDSDIILVTGDLTEDGSELSHLKLAEQFKKIENSGKKVYVINGNHDIDMTSYDYNGDTRSEIKAVTANRFYEIYYEFGFDEAVSRCSENLSYSVNIDDDYKLICLDPSVYSVSQNTEIKNMGKFTETCLQWAENQCAEGIKEGRKLIAMTHIPFLNHMLSQVNSTSFVVENNTEVIERLMKCGLEYVFTGHIHQQNIASYSDNDGKTFYDIQTGSLMMYPVPVREVCLFKNKVKINTLKTKKVDKKYIAYDIDKELNVAVKDLQSFSRKHMVTDVETRVKTVIRYLYGYRYKISGLLQKLGINENFSDKQTFDMAHEIITDFVDKVLSMPLYGEKSVEALCNKYNVKLPKIKQETLIELVGDIVADLMGGDENNGVDSDKSKVLKYSIYAILNMSDESNFLKNLHEIYDFIPNLDFSTVMEGLFVNGKMEVTNSGILYGINTILPDNFKSIITPESKLSDFKNLLEGFSDKEILGMKPLKYLDYVDNSIDINKLLEEGLFGIVLKDILVDTAPQDGNFTFSVIDARKNG